MYFILLAMILAVAGGIISNITKWRGRKQLIKYDKEHSDVACADAEELASKINLLDGVENLEIVDGKISFDCKKNTFSIAVENGIAYVEYDTSGCEIKFSKMGRFLGDFKLADSAKKATMVNSIMDSVSGKDVKEQKKAYAKIINGVKAMKIIAVAMFVCLAIGILGVFNGTKNVAVENVKNTQFEMGLTYGELLDNYLPDAKWTYFISENDTPIVEVNGISIEGESVCVQFEGELGMGGTNLEQQDFDLGYMDADGEPVDAYSAFAYIYEYLYG